VVLEGRRSPQRPSRSSETPVRRRRCLVRPRARSPGSFCAIARAFRVWVRQGPPSTGRPLVWTCSQSAISPRRGIKPHRQQKRYRPSTVDQPDHSLHGRGPRDRRIGSSRGARTTNAQTPYKKVRSSTRRPPGQACGATSSPRFASTAMAPASVQSPGSRPWPRRARGDRRSTRVRHSPLGAEPAPQRAVVNDVDTT
jgi:hypothetical protein